jgi:hypothetical protein
MKSIVASILMLTTALLHQHKSAEVSVVTTTTEPKIEVYEPTIVPPSPDPYDEFIGKIIFTERFMEAVAQCETGQDLKHIGHASSAYGEGATFRGAFGNWTKANGGGTWSYYGGREFAHQADEANYRQQKAIYIRKSLYGWYDYNRNVFVPPAGVSRNNCLEYASPIEYRVHWGNLPYFIR